MQRQRAKVDPSPSVLLFISVMLFIFIIASIPFPLRAAPGNKEEDLPGLPPLPPGETRIYGYAYALGGKVGSEFSQVSLNDGQSGPVQIRVDSGLYSLLVETDPEGNLQYSQWRTGNKDLAKLLGHDERRTFYETENRIWPAFHRSMISRKNSGNHLPVSLPKKERFMSM